MADLALLERLCCARGISGCEEEIREIILEEIRPYADCVEVTPLGNLLAFKKGANRAKTKLLLNAHMDEVGMTVTYIEDNGLLRFATVGGIDRRVLCGKPVILMQNGKILEQNLQRTRVNLDELTMHLREKGIFDLSTVKFAILETNGQLSTLLYAKEQPASARDAGIRVRETELPVTIISAGRILAENLHLAGRDGGWLEAELKRRSLTAEQVLLLTVDAAGTVYLVRKEDLA